MRRRIFDGAVVGEYGRPYTVTCRQRGSGILDLSGYTTVSLTFAGPNSASGFTLSGSVVGDGTTGKIIWAFTAGQNLSVPGVWKAQVAFEKEGELTKSYVFYVRASEAL